LHLQSLKLTNFKNHATLSLDFSPRINAFVGQNGVGKTNILDAIHLLCLSKSNAGTADKNLVRDGETFFRIDGIFEKNEQTERIVAKMQPPARKEMERNGVKIDRMIDHVGQFPVVMITPDDSALVQEGSEERRQFMDNTLCQIFPEYLLNLLIYNSLLKQRNALLKLSSEGKPIDWTLLETLNFQMFAPAPVIFAHRKRFLENFQPTFQHFYEKISGGHETVEIEYISELFDTDFSEGTARNQDKDRHLGRTNFGPHRDDLVFKMNETLAKKRGSQGQLKSLLLAIRLAQYDFLRKETQLSPVLLLDDIFDKLDASRVSQLIRLILDNAFGQVFITDTHETRVQVLLSAFLSDFRMFNVPRSSAS
jgi:DNA replication and repair protein RecF